MNIKKYARAIGKYLSDSNYRFLMNAGLGKYNNLSDKKYLERKFECCMGKSLDFEHPQTFNEKLQWLKLYDRKSEYTVMVDKYKVREYIKNKIGEEYLIPLIGVWDDPDDIDFDALPDKFVLKCNHNSGLGMCICKDKSNLDIKKVKNELRRGLAQDYYLTGREWPYKNVPRRIIAEQYMAEELRDYKQLFFESAPRMTLVYSERFTKEGVKEDFYDEVWNHLNIPKTTHGEAVFSIQRPKQYELMKRLVENFSEKMSFARIDFYEINEKVYFGEISFSPEDGFEAFTPEEWNLKLGEWVKLPARGGYRLNSDDCSIIISNSYYNNKVEKSINDYKIFCFNGEIDSVMVCTGREKGHPDFYFYDTNWNRLYYQQACLEKAKIQKANDIKKPQNLEEMLSIAKVLSQGLSHVRVDLFDIDNNIYFGELTFFDNSGFDTDISYETDLKWGEKIILPRH